MTRRLLVVDDDDATRRLIRLNLEDGYEIADTGDPKQALALALEHKPDAILLDLRMPGFSGLELCQTFSSFSATQMIPIFVVSGESGDKTRAFCRDLGAADFFEKPINFQALRASLAKLAEIKRPEWSEVRVRLRVVLKLRGNDVQGKPFEEVTATENVSLNGFLCGCAAVLKKDSIVEVYLVREGEEFVGKARTVRSEWRDSPYPRYAFEFAEKTGPWVLQ